jgi:hypothetical protein
MIIEQGSRHGYGIMIIKMASGITLTIDEEETLTVVDKRKHEFKLTLDAGDPHDARRVGHLLSNGFRADHSDHCG